MNSDKTVRCWLVATDCSHQDIELPDGEVVFVGRSARTNIADTQVSRLHGLFAARSITAFYTEVLLCHM